MKNLLYLGTAAAALLYFLRQKRAAGENIRVEPVDIAIDSARSSSSFWTRIYYNVKLKLINAETASVNVSAINLNVLVNNTPFGSINNTTGFVVAAGSEKIVNLEASFSSLGVIEAIRDLISDGLKFNVTVSGYVDTDLGRIQVQFSKNVGGSGIGSPIPYTYKNFSYVGMYFKKSDLLNDVEKLGKKKNEYKIVERLMPVKKSLRSYFKKTKREKVKQYLLYVK
jgi:LEA14-like dessication related protein